MSTIEVPGEGNREKRVEELSEEIMAKNSQILMKSTYGHIKNIKLDKWK